HGLRMETTLDPEDPDVKSIVGKMKRGDLDKMSFAFLPTVQEWDDSGDVPLRTIQEAQLFDVSIVTNPAYDGTDIGLRSLEEHRKERKRENFQAAAQRIRLSKDLDLRVRRTAR
ncbi:MAG TPA: HK97 family phage prohead protease, partial [Arenicellales bacterium]|nr:HK97 family phage prohead protease [Arenicellales bacterium]